MAGMKPSQLKKRYITMMTRRMFSTSILAGAATGAAAHEKKRPRTITDLSCDFTVE
jgi:hypothetical protein